jgi:dUTP pyrophosphatase
MEVEYLSENQNVYKYKTNSYAVLNLYISPDETNEFRELYKKHVEKHNANMINDKYPNSGFDLLVPTRNEFLNLFETQFLNMSVKGEMFYYEKGNAGVSSAFYMYPRSSISKTPLMMANHTGVIDMGYRGYLIGAFRYLYNSSLCFSYDSGSKLKYKYVVEKHTRLVQICHPSLCPIFVKIIENPEELSSTERDTGGFGSTNLP